MYKIGTILYTNSKAVDIWTLGEPDRVQVIIPYTHSSNYHPILAGNTRSCNIYTIISTSNHTGKNIV